MPPGFVLSSKKQMECSCTGLHLKKNVFLAVLGLCCCAHAFSSSSQQGLLCSCGVWASHCGAFSCCRARSLGMWAQ